MDSQMSLQIARFGKGFSTMFATKPLNTEEEFDTSLEINFLCETFFTLNTLKSLKICVDSFMFG